MELTEDEIVENYGKPGGHCSRNTPLPYEYEFTCIVCGFNLIKRKHELKKIQRKKIYFIKRLINVEQKIFCICVYVYKIYEGNDYDKTYEALSTFKNKKLKMSNILIKKYKNVLENPDFEQNQNSKTATTIYKIGQHGIRSMN